MDDDDEEEDAKIVELFCNVASGPVRRDSHSAQLDDQHRTVEQLQ